MAAWRAALQRHRAKVLADAEPRSSPRFISARAAQVQTTEGNQAEEAYVRPQPWEEFNRRWCADDFEPVRVNEQQLRLLVEVAHASKKLSIPISARNLHLLVHLHRDDELATTAITEDPVYQAQLERDETEEVDEPRPQA